MGRRRALGHTPGMGFNPFRPQRRSPADYVFVGAGILVAIVAVLWAAGVF